MILKHTILLLLPLHIITSQVKTCSTPSPDPCLPGGKYDSITKSCTGYSSSSNCFACYSGANCEVHDSTNSCTVSLTGGQPVMFEEYFELLEDAQVACTTTSEDYRNGYQFSESGTFPPLEEEIRKLHKNVGNAEIEGYEIVIGNGGTGVMNAILYAVASQASSSSASSPPSILVQAPFYTNYKNQVLSTYSNPNKHLIWDPSADPLSNSTFEINTYPNNPTGQKRAPLVNHPSRVIYDCIYNWPQFTELDTTPLAGEIMTFSASKNTGHAGSRLGWALVRDPAIASLMREFVQLSLGVSIDSQLRIMNVLNYINSQYEEEEEEEEEDSSHPSFYSWGKEKMSDRFDKVSALFPNSQNITFSNAMTRGAYVWLQCPANIDCQQLLLSEASIEGNSGVNYGSTREFVRIQMMAREVEINDMVARLARFLLDPSPRDFSPYSMMDREPRLNSKNQRGC